MSSLGRVEILSTEFAIGWASKSSVGSFTHVFAVLDEEIIGSSVARLSRPDLTGARDRGLVDGYAFVIVFGRPVPVTRVLDICVKTLPSAEELPRKAEFSFDPSPTRRVFILGSPRSGTSQLGATLARVLDLPWDGEGHAAPFFAAAADSLRGDPTSSNSLVRFMAAQDTRRLVITALKEAYYNVHSSASFIDKTPGAPMISAALFLAECFSDAHFIFIRRNPVANILSRVVKFGGSFEEHCADWAAAMEAWLLIRSHLPSFLEIQQETMLNHPSQVAADLASYLGLPDAEAGLTKCLKETHEEHTGAGLHKSLLAETQWSQEQQAIFTRVCGPAMCAYDYTTKNHTPHLDPSGV